MYQGAAIIINSNISNNESDENVGGDRRTVIANTTISGNQAKENGGIQVVGGVIRLVPFAALQEAANLELTNVTITNNVADSDFEALAISFDKKITGVLHNHSFTCFSFKFPFSVTNPRKSNASSKGNNRGCSLHRHHVYGHTIKRDAPNEKTYHARTLARKSTISITY